MSRIPKSQQLRVQQQRSMSNRQACFGLGKSEPGNILEVIQLSRKSGELNLTGRGMADVPQQVWGIDTLTDDERRGPSLSFDQREGDRWWEQADLTKLYLSSNRLSCLSTDIENLHFLTILEVNDNDLASLPDTIGNLRQLTKLNISRNKIKKLPNTFFQLKELRQLVAHNNAISELSDDISNLSYIGMMDLSHNKLTSLPAMIGFLSRITNLNLSNNKLSQLPPEMGSMNALKILDISSNQLKSLPQPIASLCHLEQLFVHHNDLTALPPFSGCTRLKELHVSNNDIEEFPIEVIETLLGLKTLGLKCNKLSSLSPDITTIQGLERLDLSNNNLVWLPYELGTLVHLKCLSVEGNPLKTIDVDTVKRGTVHLLKWLQDGLDESLENATDERLSGGAVLNDGSDLAHSTEKFALRTTHALELSKRSLQDVPEEIFRVAPKCDACTVDLSNNVLEAIPKGLEIACPVMTELKLGFNKLSSLPGFLCLATRLTLLDLRNNQLSDLPMEMSTMPSVREVNMSFNRFSHIPKVVTCWPALEILFASDNKIEQLDVAELRKLTSMVVLDLRNNNIHQVPPELGNMQQLRNLQLEGNPFRYPRPATLSKGTSALLEFLRNRIPR